MVGQAVGQLADEIEAGAKARAYLADCSQRVDGALDRILPSAAAAPTDLHAAMRHLIFPGGKRLRPALAMAAAEAVGAPAESALAVATAVELVHTYSLIHDDLPCMDDDAVRRGRPTVHVAYGEAVAVLAGDALLTLAFECLADAGTGDAEALGGSSVSPACALLAARDLAAAVGAAGLVGGQADDLTFAQKRGQGGGGKSPEAAQSRAAEMDAAHVLSIHERKTAALIRASIVGGARLAGADEGKLAVLSNFGTAVGVAFQIADDLLDADEDEGCSLVSTLGSEEARSRAEALLDQALALSVPFGARAEPLRTLARFAARRSV